MNVQPIPAIEEVNMFKSDGNVIHFAAPKGESPKNKPLVAPTHLLTRAHYSSRRHPLQHLRHLRQR